MSGKRKGSVPVIDLFAGAGGLSIGAQLAGGDVRLDVEMDHICCETLRANRPDLPDGVIESDIAALTGEGLRKLAGLSKSDPLIIVGGPPCQPFSKAAYWTDPGEEFRYRCARASGKRIKPPTVKLGPREDDRRDLVQEFLRIVRESKATGFVFENVASILHPRNQNLVEGLLSSFRELGYHVTLVRANAAEYGVPQLRHRVFILGHKRGQPLTPIPSHFVDESLAADRSPAMTSGEALRGLNHSKYFEPAEIVSGRWAELFKEIPPGWNYKWHTAWAGHANPSFVTETRFWSFLLKLSPAKPSWTIAASPGPWVGPFHWDNRRLRTVEMAALQGFPRSYKFTGQRRDVVRQIGNAVPPPLAAVMLKEVLVFDTSLSSRKAK